MKPLVFQFAGEPDAEFAYWLVEAGLRRNEFPPRVPRPFDKRGAAAKWRLVALLALFAASALHYLHTDARLKISRLPALIVFVGDTAAH